MARVLWAGTQGPQARSEGTGHRHRPAASGPPVPPSHLPARRFLCTQSPWALLWGERGDGEQSGGAGEWGNARSSTPPPAQQDLTPGWGLCPSPPPPPSPRLGWRCATNPAGCCPANPSCQTRGEEEEEEEEGRSAGLDPNAGRLRPRSPHSAGRGWARQEGTMRSSPGKKQGGRGRRGE